MQLFLSLDIGNTDMNKEQIDQAEASELTLKERLQVAGITGLGDLCMFGWLQVGEMARAMAVHPELNSGFLMPDQIGEPLLESGTFLHDVLSHSGDVWDGGMIAVGTYYTLTLASLGKLPERIRAVTAMAAGIGMVALQEAGHLFQGGTNDVLDIPIPALFLVGGTMAHAVIREFAEQRVRGGRQELGDGR